MVFGFLKVKGYQGIVKQDEELNQAIKIVDNLNKTQYEQAKLGFESVVKQFDDTKEEYLAKLESMKTKKKIQIDIYELDFLWTRIGNYATECDLKLQLDVEQATNIETLNDFKLYNLNFTVDGLYTDVVRFIYKIEGDSEVAAQLSTFTMEPSAYIDLTETVETTHPDSSVTTNSTSSRVQGLRAKFVLKNIPLNHKNITGVQTREQMPGMMNHNDPSMMQGTPENKTGNQAKPDVIDKLQAGQEVDEKEMLTRRNQVNR